MRKLVLSICILLSSCSDFKNTSGLLERGTASIGDQCSELVGHFIQNFDKKFQSNITKEDLILKKIINEREIDFLQNKVIANELAKNQDNRQHIEVSFLLIKKKYQHFDEEQIVKHYHLLEDYCGM